MYCNRSGGQFSWIQPVVRILVDALSPDVVHVIWHRPRTTTRSQNIAKELRPGTGCSNDDDRCIHPCHVRSFSRIPSQVFDSFAVPRIRLTTRSDVLATR